MKFRMTQVLVSAGAVVMTAGAVLFAQGGDANKVLAEMRQALGGEKKLAAVQSLTATGKSERVSGTQTSGGDYEMALQFPDKFISKKLLASTPFGNVSLTSGFNGNALIQETESPQAPGGVRMMVAGAGVNATPDQQAAQAVKQLKNAKQETARMALAMFGSTSVAFPAEFTYGGVAEAPDGKADIINVKGADDFAGKLFIDQKTHLPLMYSWMDKEPVQMNSSVGGNPSTGAGAGRSMSAGGGNTSFVQQGNMSKEDRDKMMKDMQDRIKELQDKAKMVEYRVFYGDWKDVDGMQLPHTFQESIAGNPSTQITIEKYKLNAKIDAKRFEPKK